MKHARDDYNRMQDPASDPLTRELIGALAFARSAIKCGEPWTETCETVINGAIEKLTARTVVGEGSTPIAEDEPVVLFRAQDKNFLSVLNHFRSLLLNDHDTRADIIESVGTQMERGAAWQAEHGCHTPDLPTA